jgi:hypothetical protein
MKLGSSRECNAIAEQNQQDDCQWPTISSYARRAIWRQTRLEMHPPQLRSTDFRQAVCHSTRLARLRLVGISEGKTADYCGQSMVLFGETGDGVRPKILIVKIYGGPAASNSIQLPRRTPWTSQDWDQK